MTPPLAELLASGFNLPNAEDLDDLVSVETQIEITLDCYVHAILQGDVATYSAMTAEDVSVYEWFLQGGRMDGRSLHEELIEDREVPEDLQWTIEDLKVRLVGDVAITSYTLRLRSEEGGYKQEAVTDETRVFELREGRWICVHVHKSPHGFEEDV